MEDMQLFDRRGIARRPVRKVAERLMSTIPMTAIVVDGPPLAPVKAARKVRQVRPKKRNYIPLDDL